MKQAPLFERPLPAGLVLHPRFLSGEEEAALLSRLRDLRFERLAMHGVVARRRVLHYGMSYDYGRRAPRPGEAIPEWLLPLRGRVADAAGIAAESWKEILVTEYPPGAPIGWHRDAPAFDVIAGVSLGSACRLRLRRSEAGARESFEIRLEPGSLYVLGGEARRAWEHSIPPVTSVRYSITLRTLA